jgi:hypothetical protein
MHLCLLRIFASIDQDGKTKEAISIQNGKHVAKYSQSVMFPITSIVCLAPSRPSLSEKIRAKTKIKLENGLFLVFPSVLF